MKKYIIAILCIAVMIVGCGKSGDISNESTIDTVDDEQVPSDTASSGAVVNADSIEIYLVGEDRIGIIVYSDYCEELATTPYSNDIQYDFNLTKGDDKKRVQLLTLNQESGYISSRFWAEDSGAEYPSNRVQGTHLCGKNMVFSELCASGITSQISDEGECFLCYTVSDYIENKAESRQLMKGALSSIIHKVTEEEYKQIIREAMDQYEPLVAAGSDFDGLVFSGNLDNAKDEVDDFVFQTEVMEKGAIHINCKMYGKDYDFYTELKDDGGIYPYVTLEPDMIMELEISDYEFGYILSGFTYNNTSGRNVGQDNNRFAVYQVAEEDRPDTNVLLSDSPGITKVCELDEPTLAWANAGIITYQGRSGYGAMDYEGNEIVPCEHFSGFPPNKKGYFVMAKEDKDYTGYVGSYDLYSPQGELITSSSHEIIATGNYYIVKEHEKLTYYDLDGNLIVETEIPRCYSKDCLTPGCRDGVILLSRNSADGTSDQSIIEIGKLYEDGTVEWQTDTTKLLYNEVLFSGLNGGYYLTANNTGDIDSIYLYDADGNRISEFCPQYMSSEGIYTEGKKANKYKPTLMSYDNDGTRYYNKGTKVVLSVGDVCLLIDLVTKECIARYDRITMDGDEDIWRVSDGEKQGYIDSDGNQLGMFDQATDFCNGYAFVREGENAYLIGRDMNKLEKLEDVGQYQFLYCFGDLLGVDNSLDDGISLYKVNGT